MKKFKSIAAGLSAVWLVLTLALAGCGSSEPQSIRVSGTLTYAQDASVPDHASARISMIEKGKGESDSSRIVAERSLHDVSQKPVRFDLDVARDLIDPEGDYRLRAEIVGADGNTRWETRQPVPIEPLQRKQPVAITLDSVVTESELAFNKYRCDDGFHLSAANSQTKAVVRLGNRRLVLKPAQRGADKEYSDEHGNTLQINDSGLVFQVDGEQHHQCQVVADQTPAPDDADKTQVGDNDANAANATVASTHTTPDSQADVEQGVVETQSVQDNDLSGQ